MEIFGIRFVGLAAENSHNLLLSRLAVASVLAVRYAVMWGVPPFELEVSQARHANVDHGPPRPRAEDGSDQAH